MNFFSGSGDLAKGVMNMMTNNKWSGGNQKQSTLRKKLESCTYPDETKYMIEKAIKQVFHVYPFFDADIIMFNQNGFQRRYMEVKGIIELEIKSKTCKVDFNMMLPAEYPRKSPFIRIVNRNPDYNVDPFYHKLQSNNDKSSYVLNQKLNTCKNWHPSNSLVNVIIQCYDMLKTRFPFTKPISQNPSYGGSSPWDAIAKKGIENFGGGGFQGNQGGGNWGGNQWSTANQNAWGNPGNQGGWGGGGNVPTGGMGSIMGNNNANSGTIIGSAQKLVGKQKQTISQLNTHYSRLLQQNQNLDLIKQSIESQQSTLRRSNFEMSNFLKENEGGKVDLTNVVIPKDDLSVQILDLASSLKAREDCILLLQHRFNEEEIKLEDFMKQLRKMEETRFQERVLLQKCIKHAN